MTMLCYFGAARAGEVLSCSRADLLLPADLMAACLHLGVIFAGGHRDYCLDEDSTRCSEEDSFDISFFLVLDLMLVPGHLTAQCM